VATAAAALAGIGCEGDLRVEEPPPMIPRFFPGSCEASLPAGISVECGTVRVPERRGDPASPEIAVRLAVIRARDGSPDAPRAAYLAGPAGSSGVASAIYYAGWTPDASLRALLATRTLVAIDLRGTGGSSPSLRCEGVRVAALPGSADRVDPDTEQAVAACRARLSDGRVSPAAYGTAAAAEDVEAIRLMLGGQRWDLVGSGYGARVALEVMRRYPAGVRAAVLDSVIPPDVDQLAEEAPAAARALEVMATRCGRDPTCQAAYPDPLGALAAVIGRLTAEPVEIASHGGPVVLTGAAFARAVLAQLQEPGGASRLPERLYQAQAGEYGFFAAVLAAPRAEGSLGAHLSVMCGEALRATSRASIEARAAPLPLAARAALASRFYPLICPIWAVPQAPAVLREAVRGSVPLLLLSGSHDPLSPPAWSRQVAAGFAAARAVELADQGHALLRAPCPAAMAAGFLEDPAGPVPADCAALPAAGVPR
jgi:pimeloyl-ACP methyl ester carboxylesterase